MARQDPAEDPRVAVANGIDRVRRSRTLESVRERAQAREELRHAVARAEEEQVIDEHLHERQADHRRR